MTHETNLAERPLSIAAVQMVAYFSDWRNTLVDEDEAINSILSIVLALNNFIQSSADDGDQYRRAIDLRTSICLSIGSLVVDPYRATVFRKRHLVDFQMQLHRAAVMVGESNEPEQAGGSPFKMTNLDKFTIRSTDDLDDSGVELTGVRSLTVTADTDNSMPESDSLYASAAEMVNMANAFDTIRRALIADDTWSHDYAAAHIVDTWQKLEQADTDNRATIEHLHESIHELSEQNSALREQRTTLMIRGELVPVLDVVLRADAFDHIWNGFDEHRPDDAMEFAATIVTSFEQLRRLLNERNEQIEQLRAQANTHQQRIGSAERELKLANGQAADLTATVERYRQYQEDILNITDAEMDVDTDDVGTIVDAVRIASANFQEVKGDKKRYFSAFQRAINVFESLVPVDEHGIEQEPEPIVIAERLIRMRESGDIESDVFTRLLHRFISIKLA